MARLWSLAYLTSLPLTFPQAIRVAAACGYDAVGPRILPSAPGGPFDDLIGDKALLREAQALLAATGVAVFDVEIIRIGADFDVAATTPFLEVAAELGARAILVAGDDADAARLTGNYARFCEAAHPYGLTADLEFMPWTAVPDCQAALRIVSGAAQPNAGVLVDGIHFGRSTTTLADLRAIPRQWLHYAQLCDATPGTGFTTAELIHTAREERFLPGEKGIDLAGMLGALPADLPLSIEVPNVARKAVMGVEAWCAAALAAGRGV